MMFDHHFTNQIQSEDMMGMQPRTDGGLLEVPLLLYDF